MLAEKLVVPRLRVRKDWYKGLDDDPTDHSHPDVGIRPDAQDGSTGSACKYIRLVSATLMT